MSTRLNPDTEDLVLAVSQGHADGRGQLLERHRERLRRMVAVRIDRRLSARIDPSDIVQESLVDAASRLSAYVRERPLPFYPWLRRIATDRLADASRKHVRAGRRSVGREQPLQLSSESVMELAERLLARSSARSARLHRADLNQRVRAALSALPERDREVLVLRYLEDLPTSVAVASAKTVASSRRVKTRVTLTVQAGLANMEVSEVRVRVALGYPGGEEKGRE